MTALNFRIKNCQPEFDVFTDLETGEKKMLLKTGLIIPRNEIAKRLLETETQYKFNINF